jgi:hypothetical protein
MITGVTALRSLIGQGPMRRKFKLKKHGSELDGYKRGQTLTRRSQKRRR